MQEIGRRFEPLLLIGSAIDFGGGDKEQARAVLQRAFLCELYEIQVRRGRCFLHTHSQSADSWDQPTMVDFMNRFPDTFRTVTDSCLFGPTNPSKKFETADRVVEELRLYRTSTQYTNPLAQHAPDDHEGNVPAITTRLVCRCDHRTATTSSASTEAFFSCG